MEQFHRHRKKKKKLADSCNLELSQRESVIENHRGQKCLPLKHRLLIAEGQHSPLMVVMLPNEIMWCV